MRTASRKQLVRGHPGTVCRGAFLTLFLVLSSTVAGTITRSSAPAAAAAIRSPTPLLAVSSPCATGLKGWAMPLPGQYLRGGLVDQGVDYAAPGGTPECAMGDGTIIGEGGPGLGGYGPWAPILKITDGPLAGRSVYYGHAGPDLVPVGAHVTNGQQITIVGYGIVGISTGPHLEIGFYPPGSMGAGQAMLDYINGAVGYNTGASNCAIYSSPATGTHQVCGAIMVRYQILGGPGGFLGYPITNETTTPDRIGRFNHFANSGSIYWTPSTGAWSIHGTIRAKWASLGWERSFLGYPVTDERGTPDGIGRFNHFSSNHSLSNVNGSIYWTPGTGAWSIHGPIRAKWASLGWERSCLGYPVSDEFAVGVDRRSNFQHGFITWNSTTGVTTSSC